MLAQRYANSSDVVTSIELLNEPQAEEIGVGTVQSFYDQGYSTVSSAIPGIEVTIQDGFLPDSQWNGFNPGPNTMLDTHQYQIFSSDQLQESPDDHVSSACSFASTLAGLDKPTVVGEWCGALTDCAKYLNGFGIGARYDGTYTIEGGSSYIGSCEGKSTGTVDGLSGDDKTNIRRFIEAQLDAYSSKTGWFWWTWKTEGAPEWDLGQLIAGGLFPQPLNDRQYPNQCGSS